MDNTAADAADEAPCICAEFVPENKRVDFLAIRENAKTGKPERKVVLRYHRDCPEHGINLRTINKASS